MTQVLSAYQGYARRTVPDAYDPAWLREELAYVQRGMRLPVSKTVTTTYTASPSDDVLFCDASGGAFTVTLPDPTRVRNMRITIKKIDASGNAITIGATVDGGASPTVAAQYDTVTVQSDGSAWYFIGVYP